VPLPRFDRLPEARRAEILQAATAELVAHGPREASVNRILKAAGLSKGAFYYYFDDKADLYATVLEDGVGRPLGQIANLVFDTLHEQTTADLFWTHLEQTTVAGFGLLVDDELALSLVRGLYEHPDLAPVDRLLAPVRDHARRLLAHGHSLGAIRDDLPDDLLLDAIVGLAVAMDRWFARNLDTTPPDELMRLSLRSLAMFRDLLEPREA